MEENNTEYHAASRNVSPRLSCSSASMLFVFRCFVCTCPLSPGCVLVRLTQRKQLTAPGPCSVLASPGGERLGASRTATNRALSAPRINAISSGSGPAGSHTHTQMHAWYAHMLRESASGEVCRTD